MAKQFTLGSQERLKSRKRVEELFRSGKKMTVSFLKVHFNIHPSVESGLQLGVGASSKIFKKAVDRNRIKRQIREAWRLQKIPLQETLQKKQRELFVFLVYLGTDLPEYKAVYEQVGLAIRKLLKVANTDS